VDGPGFDVEVAMADEVPQADDRDPAEVVSAIHYLLVRPRSNAGSGLLALGGEGGQDGGGQDTTGLGGVEAAGLDLLGGGVHEAVEGGHPPGGRQGGGERA